MRSRDEASIAELRQLAASGYREVVLSAISLPSYGLDTGTNLVELVEHCAQVEGIQRIRLGSLDPDMLTPEFITRLAAVEKLCPQFHLSLQSGCTRHPAPDAPRLHCRAVCTGGGPDPAPPTVRARSVLPPTASAASPARRRPILKRAANFSRKSAFSRCMCSLLPPQRHPGLRLSGAGARAGKSKERSRVMNGIAEEVRREVLAAYVGTEDDVLLETPLSGTLFTGYTGWYIPVAVSAPGHESGQIVHVTLGEYDGERVRAALC